jgi:type I restriction enzyme, S subunit
MSEEKICLPQGWSLVAIHLITLPVEKTQADTPNREIEYIDISGIDNILNRISETKRLTFADAPSRARQIVRAGDVLFSTVRPYLRNIAAVPKSYDGEIASTGFAILRPAYGVAAKYLFYYAISNAFVNALSGVQYGVSYPAVKNEQVRAQEINLAPTIEQHRIVAKIEELFSEIDKGVESLETAKAQLRVYRQSLLKHAFEGKLTAQWRRDNPDQVVPAEQLLEQIKQAREERYQQQLEEWEGAVKRWKKEGEKGKKPTKPRMSKELPPLTTEELNELTELPEGWRWMRVAELGDVQLGRQRSPNNRSKDFPTKYIRAANLTNTGLDLDDLLDMEFTPDERQRYYLRFGDVVLSEASGSASQVGKPAVWKNQLEDCCFQNTVIRVQPPLQFSDFLFWVFKTYYLTGVFSREAGGVGINHLSAGKLASLAVPITSLSEANKILGIVSEKLSVIEHLEETICTSLVQADALRQSILKKAFSGQLVPQDPTDEPASQLLERIKAEKSPPAPLCKGGSMEKGKGESVEKGRRKRK